MEFPGEKAVRPKAAGGGPRKRRRKGRKGSEDEALEDSDDGDFEGQEVDYMSDGSRWDLGAFWGALEGFRED